jgi:hypothetical protein
MLPLLFPCRLSRGARQDTSVGVLCWSGRIVVTRPRDHEHEQSQGSMQSSESNSYITPLHCRPIDGSENAAWPSRVHRLASNLCNTTCHALNRTADSTNHWTLCMSSANLQCVCYMCRNMADTIEQGDMTSMPHAN